MDPATMMVGMAVGSTIGRQMAGTMDNVMNGMQQSSASAYRAPLPAAGQAAPPPPVMQYNVAVNGQITGPFTMNTLTQMAQGGQLTPQSQVWKQGMPGWAAAGTVQELSGLFSPACGGAASAVAYPPPSQVQHKERVMHVYDEKNFYSMGRLMEFGMSTNVAQQMVNNMNHHLQNMYIPGAGNPMRPPQQTAGSRPPDIQVLPEPIYYAVIDDAQSGPYCETELARLINDKKVTKETYIWYTGISEWTKAENIPTILRLVALAPPPLPTPPPLPPSAEGV
ncbi:MAG: DUF4339 domain-containing protein [Treponema sp.]|nr:DUF4339 domain-containing protein [Treponema sp.]